MRIVSCKNSEPKQVLHLHTRGVLLSATYNPLERLNPTDWSAIKHYALSEHLLHKVGKLRNKSYQLIVLLLMLVTGCKKSHSMWEIILSCRDRQLMKVWIRSTDKIKCTESSKVRFSCLGSDLSTWDSWYIFVVISSCIVFILPRRFYFKNCKIKPCSDTYPSPVSDLNTCKGIAADRR